MNLLERMANSTRLWTTVDVVLALSGVAQAFFAGFWLANGSALAALGLAVGLFSVATALWHSRKIGAEATHAKD